MTNCLNYPFEDLFKKYFLNVIKEGLLCHRKSECRTIFEKFSLHLATKEDRKALDDNSVQQIKVVSCKLQAQASAEVYGGFGLLGAASSPQTK